MILPLAVSFENMHQILRNLYEHMMPLCSKMTGMATAVAGLGALLYIAVRVWQALSRAEPIDVYPLLRPFAIGLCIMFFPTFVLGTFNAVLSPVVKGTHAILENQTLDMNALQAQKDLLEEEAVRGNPATAWMVEDEQAEGKLKQMGVYDVPELADMFARTFNPFSLRKMVIDVMREILEFLFKAAALVIDTIRTFFLVVLSILGPIAFAISVYDGFQASLTHWISRYVSIYLWLPVSDLFSAVLAKIQVLSLQKDISQPLWNLIPDGTDAVYLIFLLIGIFGYFTVPSVANWIIQSGGMGGAMRGVNQAAARAASFAGGAAGAAAGNVSGRLFGGEDKQEK